MTEVFNEDRNTIDEFISFPPESIFKQKDCFSSFYNIYTYILGYFRIHSKGKTGKTDYENLWMETDSECNYLLPSEEHGYFNGIFEEGSDAQLMGGVQNSVSFCTVGPLLPHQ